MASISWRLPRRNICGNGVVHKAFHDGDVECLRPTEQVAPALFFLLAAMMQLRALTQ